MTRRPKPDAETVERVAKLVRSAHNRVWMANCKVMAWRDLDDRLRDGWRDIAVVLLRALRPPARRRK